jgi:Fe-S-cluster-containing hydrogenase component 2
MTITDLCLDCGSCEYDCPTGAVYQGADKHEIDARLCDECADTDEPRCASQCPVDGIVRLEDRNPAVERVAV